MRRPALVWDYRANVAHYRGCRPEPTPRYNASPAQKTAFEERQAQYIADADAEMRRQRETVLARLRRAA